MIILAIESSCDETSIAIIEDGKLLSNVVSSQIKTHQLFGGVMPEVASRLHAENVLFVLDEALRRANVTLEQVDAYAFTRGPGLVGALHIGMQVAKTLAMLFNKPLIPVHHLAAHIYANEFVGELKFPLLSVVVSGGNTELVLMEKPLDFKIIGETSDDAVGECFDKVARTLGLPYPGGVIIDKLAKEGKDTYHLPIPHADGEFNFSYSGLKTAIINLVHNEKQKGNEIRTADLCRSFENVAIKMIVDRTIRASEKYAVKQIVLAGGVSANSYLREEMIRLFKDRNIEMIIPPLWCTGDNAAMIAKLAEHLYKDGLTCDLLISADPNWQIDCFRDF